MNEEYSINSHSMVKTLKYAQDWQDQWEKDNIVVPEFDKIQEALNELRRLRNGYS